MLFKLNIGNYPLINFHYYGIQYYDEEILYLNTKMNQTESCLNLHTSFCKATFSNKF